MTNYFSAKKGSDDEEGQNVGPAARRELLARCEITPITKCELHNVGQQGHKTAISSLRLNFEQQALIAAIQPANKPASHYLTGLKGKVVVQSPSHTCLNKLLLQLE